jgi:hypothetical protein
VVLSGEPPDPTLVPSGCRFHVRCPVLGSGLADEAGVGEQCRTVDLEILGPAAESQVACHYALRVATSAVRRSAGPHAEERP